MPNVVAIDWLEEASAIVGKIVRLENCGSNQIMRFAAGRLVPQVTNQSGQLYWLTGEREDGIKGDMEVWSLIYQATVLHLCPGTWGMGAWMNYYPSPALHMPHRI